MTPFQGTKLWTRDFILLCVSNFLMFTAFYLLIPTLPVYLVQTFHANKTQVGIVLAAYTLAAMIIRPFTGIAIDSYGRKWIFLFGMGIFALLFNVYILALSVFFIVCLRFVHGLLWGITTTAANTAVVDLIPAKRRGEGIGIFGLSFTVAMAIGPFLGIIISNNEHYTTMFFIGFLMVLAGFLLAMNIRFPEYLHARKPSVTLANLIETTSIPVSINLLIINITYGGIISFIALYGREIGVPNPGLFFLVYAAGISLTRFFAGKILDKFGPHIPMTAGMLLMAAGFPVLALLKTDFGFLLSAALMGLGGGVVMPTFQTMVNNMVAAQKRGAANSTLFTSLDLGIGIGMVLIGFLSEKFSLTVSFLICAGIILCGIVFFLSYVQRHYDKHKLNIIH